MKKLCYNRPRNVRRASGAAGQDQERPPAGGRRRKQQWLRASYIPSSAICPPFPRDRSGLPTTSCRITTRPPSMTASKLGKLSGVSESTVVRFASELGYDGYPSMQRALQEMIRSRLTSTQRIQAADNLVRRTGCAVRRDPVRYGQAADGGGRGGQDRVQQGGGPDPGRRAPVHPGGADLLLCGGVSELLPGTCCPRT